MSEGRQAGHEAHEGHKEHEGVSRVLELLARNIVDAGLKVHKALGPGLLESTYEHCLSRELQRRGVPFARQVPLPITYEGETLEVGYRLDMVVGESIVLEIKAVDSLTRLHDAQLLTYLRLSRYRIGFLLNFNVVLFKQGVRQLIC